MWRTKKHRCGWEGAALESDAGCGTDAAARMLVPRLSFFFFFFFEIHANSAPIHTDSARLRSYQLNWIVSASGRDWPKQPKNAEIGFEWGPNILNLSFLNFILNICCFFCVFFFVLCFVLCFSPSSFFVLWTKAIVMCFLRIF